MYRVLQFCIPKSDNLGDTLCHQTLDSLFDKENKSIKIDKINLLPYLHSKELFYDQKTDAINKNYNALIIGAGGLLGIELLTCIFDRPESWREIKIPIIFFGIGIISNLPLDNFPSAYSFNYSLLNSDVSKYFTPNKIVLNYITAIKAASLIGVRDMQSWFIVKKIRASTKNLYLTGCPTLFDKRICGNSEKKYSIALNAPFNHGFLCKNYANEMSSIVNGIINSMDNVVIICHSHTEKKSFEALVNSNKNVHLSEPNNFKEVAKIYSSCKMALVTKLHSAYFCLANNVPFAFLSYDKKCLALLEMLYDFPGSYTLELNEIKLYDVEKKLSRMINLLITQEALIKKSQNTLLDNFKHDYDLFIRELFKLCKL